MLVCLFVCLLACLLAPTSKQASRLNIGLPRQASKLELDSLTCLLISKSVHAVELHPYWRRWFIVETRTRVQRRHRDSPQLAALPGDSDSMASWTVSLRYGAVSRNASVAKREMEMEVE